MIFVFFHFHWLHCISWLMKWFSLLNAFIWLLHQYLLWLFVFFFSFLCLFFCWTCTFIFFYFQTYMYISLFFCLFIYFLNLFVCLLFVVIILLLIHLEIVHVNDFMSKILQCCQYSCQLIITSIYMQPRYATGRDWH